MRIFTSIFLFILLFSSLSPLRPQWSQTPGLVGDRITAFGIMGTELFAGTERAKIFLSTDIGLTWRSANNGFTWAPVSAFAETGGYIFAAADSGGGMFRSSDNGLNWEASNAGLTSTRVSSLVLKNGKLFAGTRGGGVFLSTDNGANWNTVNNGLTSLQVSTLAVLGDKLFAGTSDSGMFISADEGLNWSQINNGLSDKRILSLLSRGTDLFAGTLQGLFLSPDNGSDWIKKNSGLKDTSISTLASIGENLFAGTANSGVYISSDNAANWRSINAGLPQNTSVTAFAVMGPQLIMASYSGKIFLTTELGSVWTEITSGLTTRFITSMATLGSRTFAGTDTAGVFLSLNNGRSWNKVNDGLSNKKITCLATDGKDIFAGTDSSGVFRSNNNGELWTQVNSGLTNTVITALFVNSSNIYAGTSGSGAFISTDNGNNWRPSNNGISNQTVRAFAVNGKYLFAGAFGVYRSSDNGENWTAVNNGLEYKRVTSLAVLDSTVFAGIDMGGGLFRSLDNGENWTQQTGAGGFVYAIAVIGKYLFTGIAWDGVRLSDDNGATWKSVTDGFPANLSVYSLAMNSTTLFAGSYLDGVWMRPLSEMITPLPLEAPDVPRLLNPLNNQADLKEDVQCVWSKSGRSELFRICLAEDKDFKNILFCDSTLKDTLKEIKELKQGMRYFWKVMAMNTNGNSGFSEVWNFTVFLSAPEGLNAEVLSNSKIRLSWKPGANESARYIIERKQAPYAGFDAIDTTKEGLTYSYTDSTIKAPAEYIYRLKAFTPYAVSGYSNEIQLTVTEVSSVKAVPKSYSLLQNYPNPFNPATMLKYEIPEESFVGIYIYDLLGRLVDKLVHSVQAAGYYTVEFNAPNLPSGTYIYFIEAKPVSGSKGFYEARKMILLR
ncbi:MAG: T9SS type A sorting domain-containing protein [Ignavibacteria bacterium]|jgi:photosystem II stability/assembly factor-like uncharacterized protein|nr:T9SS type A sorting domain-containing protein [Ignavibacteria bacterium]MCU7504890.1 T9SS type A sorting domain-containing protein [Ignavibacteria bacterium]MCU7517847.1 T9SS type A sorting domain-containing protein [Ignavibacteria bacterium]